MNQVDILNRSSYKGQYIVYAPGIQGTVEKNLTAKGVTVVKDINSLMRLIKP